MPRSSELGNLVEPKFNWGKKRGRGGKNKKVQFYESFTYDEVEYALYDCVYMYAQDEPAPYIGKLVKIWEDAGESKKVKTHWFFRPSEISYYLKDIEVADNELFFATGEGTGLTNINPLEAIAGKCNVVCISSDSRNPRPSAEEIQMADYVFYRFFDVRNCLILDKMDDKVGGLDVEFVVNRKESNNIVDIPKLSYKNKDDDRNAIACKDIVNFSEANTVEVSKTREFDVNSDLIDKEREKSARKPGSLDNSTLKRPRLDDSRELSKHEDKSGLKTLTFPGSGTNSVLAGVTSSGAETKVGQDKSTNGPAEKAKLAESLNALEERPSQEDVLSCNEETKSGNHLYSVRTGKELELADNSIAIRGKPSNFNVLPELKPKSGHDNNSVGPGQAAKLAEDSHARERKPSKVSDSPKGRPSVHDTRNETDSAVHGKDVKFAANLHTFDRRPLKKAKVDNSVKSEDRNNTTQKLEKTVGSDAKKLLTVASNEDKTKPRRDNESIGLDKGHSKEASIEKSKLTYGNLSKLCAVASTSKNSRRVEGQIFEVTRRPVVGKSTWLRERPWEERLRESHDLGKLVLLLNLDPEYTSGEVEDIIWHAFNENCSAKMIQRTAVSSPHCGRALVIFKTKEAAEKVIRKLDDGCLMLPNRRPLVGCYGILPGVSERQTSFVGHLAVDDVRRQIQRDAKDAVSTSHYSQANTIEYEMAMDWCLLHSKSDIWWKMLYEGQKERLRKLRANLKSN